MLFPPLPLSLLLTPLPGSRALCPLDFPLTFLFFSLPSFLQATPPDVVVTDFSPHGQTPVALVPHQHGAPHRFTQVQRVLGSSYLRESFTPTTLPQPPVPPVLSSPTELTPYTIPEGPGDAVSQPLNTTISRLKISGLEKRLYLPSGTSNPHAEWLNKMCALLVIDIADDEDSYQDEDEYWISRPFYREREGFWENTRNMLRIVDALVPLSPDRVALQQFATSLAQQTGFFGHGPERFQPLYLNPPSKDDHPWALGLNPLLDPAFDVRFLPVFLFLFFSHFFVPHAPPRSTRRTLLFPSRTSPLWIVSRHYILTTVSKHSSSMSPLIITFQS